MRGPWTIRTARKPGLKALVADRRRGSYLLWPTATLGQVRPARPDDWLERNLYSGPAPSGRACR